ncbi:MAG: aspartate ammonia-lyase [Deltaproteobacteria bacterium]|nr:aspartate ammonia-lyase [Deltaproteobacteria bacterium]
MRVETDFLGQRELPDEALYGIQSLRARENFLGRALSNRRLVHALVKVKKAAALAHASLIPERSKVFLAVADACDRVLNSEADSDFIVPALQGGAGTSLNMNVNEVLANLALARLGFKKGEYREVHPLDDVNRGQSTNDVYPTALRVACVELLRELADEAAALQESLQERENEFAEIRKLGRTELMDAVPVTLGDEFGAFAQAVARDRWRLYKIEERLRQINLGGLAVGLPGGGGGTSAALARRHRFAALEKLREITGIGLALSEYPMDVTQNNDVFVEVSGLLKAMAANLAKISGDLRLMNSGPHGGLGEIRLEPLQLGSTIMPGKVNPVVPEYVTICSYKVMANDLAVTLVASRGEFELNAFLPLLAESILESLELMRDAAKVFRKKCVETLKPDPRRCLELLEASMAFAAAYAPRLGHDRVAFVLTEHAGDPRGALEALERELREKDRL